MLYCSNCNIEFSPFIYNSLHKVGDEYLCPNKHCGNGLVDIDEMFIPVMKELFDLGILSTNCCSAHSLPFIKDGNDCIMYFAYDCDNFYGDMGINGIFTDKLIEMEEEDKYSFIEVKIFKEDKPFTYFSLDGYPQDTTTTVAVYGKMPEVNDSDTPLDKHIALLRRQLEFIEMIREALHRAMDEVNKDLQEEFGDEYVEDDDPYEKFRR